MMVLSWCGLAPAQQKYRFADTIVPVDDRITDLLSKMTLDEKIDALWTNPMVPQLGVVGTGH